MQCLSAQQGKDRNWRWIWPSLAKSQERLTCHYKATFFAWRCEPTVTTHPVWPCFPLPPLPSNVAKAFLVARNINSVQTIVREKGDMLVLSNSNIRDGTGFRYSWILESKWSYQDSFPAPSFSVTSAFLWGAYSLSRSLHVEVKIAPRPHQQLSVYIFFMVCNLEKMSFPQGFHSKAGGAIQIGPVRLWRLTDELTP